MNLGAHFLLLAFFDNMITLFSKMMTAFDTYPVTQFSNSKNFVEYVDFYVKAFPILYTPLENSTTRIAIVSKAVSRPTLKPRRRKLKEYGQKFEV